ncbi:MAG: glycosyltransferase family 2 protein [Halioglobus sp.]
MKALPTVQVSLVLYHTPSETVHKTISTLLRSAERALEKEAIESLHLAIVDNSMDADFFSQIQQWCLALELPLPAITVSVQQSEVNLGYGAGHNLANLQASSDLYLILNPDVELSEGALLESVGVLSTEPSVVAVAPIATGGDGRREFLCKRYPTVWVLLLRAFAPTWLQARCSSQLTHYDMSDVCMGDDHVEVELASGCYMFVRGDALRACGGFDDRYFMYFEDFDLSMRLRAVGTILFAPEVKVIHHGGYAARKGLRHIFYFIRSGIRFFSQHGWRWI